MSEKSVRTRCLQFLVINGNLTLFDMGITSIGAYKLTAIVTKELSFTVFMSLQ